VASAIENHPKGPDGNEMRRPEIRSDNGGCDVPQEFRQVLKGNGYSHKRIRP
jgi:hypothetical protein